MEDTSIIIILYLEKKKRFQIYILQFYVNKLCIIILTNITVINIRLSILYAVEVCGRLQYTSAYRMRDKI